MICFKKLTKKVISTTFTLALAMAITACSSVAHLSQSVTGQLALWQNEVPIDSLLLPNSDNALVSLSDKQRLFYLQRVLDFAYKEVKLPNNRSYQHFVKLDQSYVVYNVVAAEPFNLKAKVSCYPVIGCQSYRGYYSKQSAIDFAKTLQQQNYDVRVGGVSAYSTLGWFKDPVYSSFFNYDDLELAALIFHELSHQVMYIADDTMFNESFATAVEILATEQWIDYALRQRLYIGYSVEAYRTKQQWNKTVIALIGIYRNKFNTLYKNLAKQEANNTLLLDDKLGAKQALFNEMKLSYQILKQKNNHNNDWDNWFKRALNNADLISIGDYFALVEEFKNSFKACDSDFTVFYNWVKKIADLPQQERLALLRADHNCTY